LSLKGDANADFGWTPGTVATLADKRQTCIRAHLLVPRKAFNSETSEYLLGRRGMAYSLKHTGEASPLFSCGLVTAGSIDC